MRQTWSCRETLGSVYTRGIVPRQDQRCITPRPAHSPRADRVASSIAQRPEKVCPFVARAGKERGFSSPRRPHANARNVLGVCDMRANGPESYQPGPTAQVSESRHFRRAEGPSHRSGMARPYRARGMDASITWAVGPGWYRARRWR